MPVAHHPEPGGVVQVYTQPVAGHGIGGRVHQALGGHAVAVAQHLWVLNRRDRYGRLLCIKAAGYVERLPGAVLLVLSDTDAELGQRTHATPVEHVGALLEHVYQYEPNGPPDGRVGPVTWAEEIAGAVECNFLPDGAVDHDEYPGRVGGSRGLVDAVGIVLKHSVHGGKHHRKVLGQTACHHSVGCGVLRSQRPAAHWHIAKHLTGVKGDILQHGFDPFEGGWHHRQAIGPAVPVAFLDGIQRLVYFVQSCPMTMLHHIPVPGECRRLLTCGF